MDKEKYDNLVVEIIQYIKDENIENIAYFLNDLKFDVLDSYYDTGDDLQVVRRGIRIEPFSKQTLSENLAKSSDRVSDDTVGDLLDTEDIIKIVDAVVEKIKEDGKKAVSSDEIVEYTSLYLEDNGYDKALEAYEIANKREDRKNES